MSEVIALNIDGETFDAWTSVRIRRSTEDLCGSFEIELVEPEAGHKERAEIRDQAACELKASGDPLLTGFIYDFSEDYDEGQHTIKVIGRDRTADLIDCSAEHKGGTWKGQKLEAIVADLVKPYALKVRVDAPTGVVFASFTLEPGEKVLEAITRACRMRGIMLRTDAEATLILYTPRPGKLSHTFTLGGNIKRLGFRSSSASRFSDYILKGQHQGGDVSAKDATGPKGTASDKGITRHRPLTIISDEQATGGGLETRALWEATTRLGRSLVIDLTFVGWRNDLGKVFWPGDSVRVIIPQKSLTIDMMISDVSLDLTQPTALTLALPEAYTTEAILEAKKKKHSGLAWAAALGGG